MNKLPDDLDAFEREEILESSDILESLRNQRSGCPPISFLRAAGAGALTEELKSAVEAHVRVCSSCRTLQSDAESIDSTDASPPEVDRILSRIQHAAGTAEASRSRRFGISWRHTAFAAASLLLCSVLVVWQFSRSKRAAPPSSTAALVQPRPAPQFPSALRLDKPAVKMTLNVLTFRSDKNSRDRFLTELAPAIVAYRTDNFAAAASSFERLSSKYTESVEVFFYLGICRLFLSDYAAAIKALEQAARIGDDSYSSDILWYLSISYQRSGQADKAAKLLQQLCGGSSGYASRACEALGELKAPSEAKPR